MIPIVWCADVSFPLLVARREKKKSGVCVCLFAGGERNQRERERRPMCAFLSSVSDAVSILWPFFGVGRWFDSNEIWR